MEQKLKRQRNRLFLRVILILLAVWLTVSAVFCAVRLSVETVNVQQQELANLSHATQLLTVGNGSAESFSRVFVDYSDFVYDPKNPENIAQPIGIIFPIAMLSGGIVALVGAAATAVSAIKKRKKLENQEKEWTNGN